MKTKLLFATVLCLFILALTQQTDAQSFSSLEERNSPFSQEMIKHYNASNIRMKWNGQGGNGVLAGMLRDPNFRAELGISNEQYERMQEIAQDMGHSEKDPDVKKVFDELAAINRAYGRELQNADEETRKRFFELIEKSYEISSTSGTGDIDRDNVVRVLEATLTQEQNKKIKEVQLVAALSDVSIFPPSMFEALGLIDVQKQEMEKIKNELDAEFEIILYDIATDRLELDKWEFDEKEKIGKGDVFGFNVLDENTRKIIREEISRIGEKMQSNGNKYAAQFKTKMFDVLTDEQWLRLQRMIDNPTGPVKMMLEKTKAWQEKKEVWTPGPNSWQPGDPIPEGYRQQRQERGRFPRVNQSE